MRGDRSYTSIAEVQGGINARTHALRGWLSLRFCQYHTGARNDHCRRSHVPLPPYRLHQGIHLVHRLPTTPCLRKTRQTSVSTMLPPAPSSLSSSAASCSCTRSRCTWSWARGVSSVPPVSSMARRACVSLATSSSSCPLAEAALSAS